MFAMNDLLQNIDVLIAGINDPKLSLQAKGLLAYICVNPYKNAKGDLNSVGGLKKKCSSADNTRIWFDKAIRELKDSGYIYICAWILGSLK